MPCARAAWETEDPSSTDWIAAHIDSFVHRLCRLLVMSDSIIAGADLAR